MDTLEIFGVEYTGVTGSATYDDDNGIITITGNCGIALDVTEM